MEFCRFCYLRRFCFVALQATTMHRNAIKRLIMNYDFTESLLFAVSRMFELFLSTSIFDTD